MNLIQITTNPTAIAFVSLPLLTLGFKPQLLTQQSQ